MTGHGFQKSFLEVVNIATLGRPVVPGLVVLVHMSAVGREQVSFFSGKLELRILVELWDSVDQPSCDRLHVLLLSGLQLSRFTVLQ